MNNESTLKLQGVLELLIEGSNRINDSKLKKYWYPLSMATYGVEEIMEALDSLCAFRTTMWKKTLTFEKKFSEFQGCEDSVMVNSGSSANLILSFLLKDINKNDKRNQILVPAVTWPTQIWSPMMVGFDVKLVDVDPNTLNIDYNDLSKKITNNTKAIFIVHLMGNPCNMDKILNISKQYNIEVIEDCCEALGAEFNGKKVGNFGLGGTTSFFFSHHMTTMEGGMVMCQSKEIADKIRVLRAHGWTRNVKCNVSDNIDPRYTFIDWGFNLRPTELQAGFGLRQLEKLPIFNVKRNELANIFYNWINNIEWLSKPIVEKNSKPSWLGLPIMVSDNAPFSVKQITEYLEKEGVETRPVVTGNVAKHPAAKKFNLIGNFPGADKIHNNGFYIGLSPMQSIKNMIKLIECFKKFIGAF